MGLTLTAGGTDPITGPTTMDSWEGFSFPVNAPDQATSDGRHWGFASWSDGGGRTHIITTGTAPATYAATLTEVAASAQTYTPVADSYVEAARPTRNNGSRNELHVDGSPILNGYLRFNVQGATDFSTAKLRLYFKNATSSGLRVHPVSNTTWGETTITYANAPAIGPLAATSGAAGAGTWVVMDVTDLVSGNGLVSFAITSSSSTALSAPAGRQPNNPS